MSKVEEHAVKGYFKGIKRYSLLRNVLIKERYFNRYECLENNRLA